MIRDNISEVNKMDTDISTENLNEVFVYDVLLVSAFDHLENSLRDQINRVLRKNELVTFFHQDIRKPLHCLSLSKVLVVFTINNEIEMNNERINLSFDLSSLRGKVIAVASEKNEEIKVWTNRQLKGADIFLWSSNQAFDHNCSKLLKKIREAIGEKEFTGEESDIKEAKIARSPVFLSTVLCTNAELFKIISETQLTEIDSSNEGGYTPIQLYFFMFLNQFTFNCPSLETVTEEISAKLFDPSNSFLYTKLSDSFSIYKDILSLNGGDYSKILLNNSLLDYFQAKCYLSAAPSDSVNEKSFISGFLPTSQDPTPFGTQKEILLSRMMTSSSDVLMKVKYFLVKIIFIILYQELQYFYVAWEFLLHQLLSDALTVRTVLNSVTSLKTEDYHIQFFMIQTLTTKNIAKDFLSQRRHPLHKVEEISNMLSRHLPKGSETLSEDAPSLGTFSHDGHSESFRPLTNGGTSAPPSAFVMAKEINELYQKHDQSDLTYYLCGRIHRHRDNWIRNNVTQNTDLTEEGKRILASTLNQSMKWIGYSLNSNAWKDSPLSMSTFRTRKKELMNGWKDSIDQLIFTLVESRLENWILPLLYLLIESIYSYQLLITHLLQLNLFQLPYSCSLLTVERKEFPSCLTFINPTDSFQPPESNYEYHVELAELSWILLKDSRHVNFTSFNQGKAWLDNCHFPFDPLIKGASKNEKSLDVEKIIAYFQIRGTKSVENEAREIIINSETNDVWKKLSNLFGNEMKLLAEPNIIEEAPDSKILHSVLSFNFLFNGEIQKFMNMLPHHFVEIHSILRKYVSTIFDYLFTLFMIVTNSFIRSQGKPFEEFIEDCKSDESLGRKYFPFLFEKLPLHYLNRFYAAMEIMTQSDSVSFVEKSDIKTVVVSAIVKFLNSFGSTSDSDGEGKLYEFLNEIRSAPRFHITLSGDKRNIRNISKKRVNSKESHEIRLKENLTKLSEETIKFEEPFQVESLPQITGSFVGHRMDRSVKVESLPHDEVFTSSLEMKFFTFHLGERRDEMDAIEQFDKPLSKYWFRLARMKSGRFYFQRKEIPQQGYATFTGLKLILGRGETLDQCNVIWTNERIFMTRNLDGWALDRQFIHTIENCPGGLFKTSMKVQLKLKDPEKRLKPSQFELRFSEEDVKQSFLNIQKIVDLCQACKDDRLEDFRNLLQGNPTLVNLPIDMTRNTLLIMACAQNKSRIAQFLLTIHGIDINKTTEVKVMRDDKETKEVYGALYYACIYNMMDVVKTLLSFKTIDVNILYTNEYSALQYAILKDMLAFKANSKKSYARIISMLMQHPKTIWKIADNSDQHAIPTKWILDISTDTQKAILRDTPKSKFPVAFRDKLEALIQEKERKIESYKSLSGEIVRVDSSSTFAIEDIESSSKICSMDSPYIINSKIFSSTVSGAVKNDPIADDIESSNKISRSQSSQSISSKLGYVDPFAEEVNHWKALLASLELPSNLKLSFVILNILRFEDDINIAESLKLYRAIALSAKQKKSWMLWKNELSAKSLPELLNGKDFESFKMFLLAQIEEKYHEGVAYGETFKAFHQLKAQVKSLLLSSKEEFVKEINQWKALIERLELSPTLQLSFVILNISNFPETTDVSARQRKLWMLWKDEIVTSINKPLSEPLNGEDFKTIKTLMLAEIKEIHANFLDNTVDAKYFADLDQLKSLVERLVLSSKRSETDCPNTSSFVAEKVKNQSEDLVLSEQKKPSFEVTAGPTSTPVIQTPFPLPPFKTSHVFISHAWAEDEEGRDNHLRVKYLNDILKKRGIVTWFDDERIRQDKNVRTTLTNALYSTCYVLICLTRKYEEKINKGDKIDHCLFEFNVATHDDEFSNAIMTVVMEPSMLNIGTWKRGRLKAELGDILYTDLSSDTNFKETCEAIAENIITTLKLTQQIV